MLSVTLYGDLHIRIEILEPFPNKESSNLSFYPSNNLEYT